jgi:MGT family glycosyltransferase
VQTLAARGHEVGYATGSIMASTVEPLVTQFFPAGPDMTVADVHERWPELGRLRGLRRLDFMAREIMFGFAASASQDVLDAVSAFQPDVLVFDSFTHAASIVAEISALPWATTSVVPGLLDTKRAAPYGVGFTYPPRPLVRLGAPLLRWLLRAAARKHDRQFNAIRAGFGLPPIRNSFLESTISPQLVLALVPPEFEYPRRAWPSQVQFVGPSLWDRPQDYEIPPWLAELPGERPLVYATIGTVQSIYQSAYFATLFEAARGLDADVVVTTGGNLEALPSPPNNVRVETYVPNSVIIPKARIVLHHGGVSSTLGTLLHGKAAVVTPFADDQPDNAQRIRWLGAGMSVDPHSASSDQLRSAIETVLASQAMQEKAAELGQQLQQYDAGATGADLLEQLARSAAPVPKDHTRGSGVR